MDGAGVGVRDGSGTGDADGTGEDKGGDEGSPKMVVQPLATSIARTMVGSRIQ